MDQDEIHCRSTLSATRNVVYMFLGVALMAATDTLASNACVSPLHWGNTENGVLESLEIFGQEQVVQVSDSGALVRTPAFIYVNRRASGYIPISHPIPEEVFFEVEAGEKDSGQDAYAPGDGPEDTDTRELLPRQALVSDADIFKKPAPVYRGDDLLSPEKAAAREDAAAQTLRSDDDVFEKPLPPTKRVLSFREPPPKD